MKKIITTLIAAIPLFAHSQVTFDWGAHYPSLNDTRVNDAAFDSKGNIYSVGGHKNTMKPTCEGTNTQKINEDEDWADFIQQIKPDGTLGFLNGLGGTDYSYAISVAVDDDDNVYVAGLFKGTHTPGDEIISNGGNDIFIMKYSLTGSVLWAKSFGGAEDELFGQMRLDQNGNIYIAGGFKDNVDFDPSSATNSINNTTNYDGFVLKLDKDGNFTWVKRAVQGNDFNNIYALAIDDNDNIYTTGFFKYIADFDPSADSLEYTAGNQDAFFQKLDKDGNVIWANKIGGSVIEQGAAITTTTDGNVIFTGRYNSDNMSLNPDPNAVNAAKVSSIGTAYDIFIIKLDGNNGSHIWSHTLNGGLDDSPGAVAADSDGYFYLTGSLGQRMNFELDPARPKAEITSRGDNDMFIARYSGEGEIKWAGTIGSTGRDIGLALAVSDDFEIAIGGFFSATADLDISSAGTLLVNSQNTSYDGFVIKMKETKEVNSIQKTALKSLSIYPNPAPSHITIALPKVIDVVITDLTGNRVIYTTETSIDISTLAQGIYFVKATDGDQHYISRLIKK